MIKEYRKQYYLKNKEKELKYQKQQRLNNPEYIKQYYKTLKGKETQRRADLKLRYGITIEDYDQMFELQNGKCKVCGSEDNGNKRFHIDHNHKSGKIRGLLCNRCNLMLGHAKEDIEILTKAIQYLKDE